MQEMITPIIFLAVLGGVFAFLLGIVSKLTYVPVDERVTQILEVLPGVNCGACGYPGCSGLANSIVEGKAPVNGCVVGGAPVGAKVAEIMGTTAEEGTRYVASVHCQGNSQHTTLRYQYDGVSSCRVMQDSFGGCKSCAYGCIGCGDCFHACNFDAIRIVDGVAVIDPDRCTQCMACIKICPKHIISLVPYDAPAQVKCMNPEFGKDVKSVCTVGCIGCGICAKTAPDEFKLNGKLAEVTLHPNFNIEKAKEAAAKCPAKCIVINDKFASVSSVQDSEKIAEVVAK